MYRDAGSPANKLLRALREEAYARLVPKLRPERLRAKQILYQANQPISNVYFPEDAVICQLSLMQNGDTIETGTVGVEGASWISASIGAPSMPCETVVVIGGDALVLSIDDLDVEMQHNESFRDVLTRYSHALLIHSMRLTACTGLHSLHQRCARWILTTLDRVSQDRFAVTHDLLALLLGAARPTVSGVIADFQAQGILTQGRGALVIADRNLLMSVACDCYEVIKQHYAQVDR